MPWAALTQVRTQILSQVCSQMNALLVLRLCGHGVVSERFYISQNNNDIS